MMVDKPDSFECPNCGMLVKYTLEDVKNHVCNPNTIKEDKK